MKKYLFLLALILLKKEMFSLVDFGPSSIRANEAMAICHKFVEIKFAVNWQVNNDQFRIWRSTTPYFVGSALVATINGCGTCGSKTYVVL